MILFLLLSLRIIFFLKRKTNVIDDYNKNKVGVDNVDQMTKFYSVKAPTRRWPMQVYYKLINIACINSWILFKEINKSRISRRDFLIKLITLKLLEEIRENYSKRSTHSTPQTPKSQSKRAQS